MTAPSPVDAAERAATQTLVFELREANERLVVETMRVQGLVDNAQRDLRLEKGRTRELLDMQRDANEHLVHASLGAQERADAANSARSFAEGATTLLQRSERELLVVAESRERLLGMITHDLRNPLNGLCMSATLLLRQGTLTTDDANLVTRILKSGKRMGRMVSRLFEFTRARLGEKWPLVLHIADVGDVIHQVVGELQATSKVPMVLELEGALTAHCDVDRLSDALSNLVGNALEYAEPGSGVTVEAFVQNESLVLRVTNRGAAIPASVLPFIFDPFRRADAKGAAKTDHLGLGLYIAHEVAVAHGGALEALSHDGVTAFTMSFPRAAS